VGLGLSNTSKTASVHSDMNPTKVSETQNTKTFMNSEASSISTSSNIPEITPINPSLEPSRKSSKFLKRKITYACIQW